MKKINFVLLSGVCIVALSSCSWISDWPPSGSKRAAAPAPAMAPQVTLMQTADATWIEPAAGGDAVATMVPTPSKATQDRMNELEQQMAQMRSDMSMMMPALTRLAEVQGDLQALLSSQIQPAAGNASGAGDMPNTASQVVNNRYEQPKVATASPTSVVAPQSSAGMNAAAIAAQRQAAMQKIEMASADASQYGYDEMDMDDESHMGESTATAAPSATPQPVYRQPVATTSGGKITSIRFGEHPDKTRIVMDVTDDIAFDYDVDNNEQILVLELGGDWSGIAQRSVSDSAMISSYSASPDGRGGTRMALQLKKAGQVSWAQHIPPADGKGHRVVIDISGL